MKSLHNGFFTRISTLDEVFLCQPSFPPITILKLSQYVIRKESYKHFEKIVIWATLNRKSERIPRRFCLLAVLARRGLRGASIAINPLALPVRMEKVVPFQASK